jgi:hypothetical protein
MKKYRIIIIVFKICLLALPCFVYAQSDPKVSKSDWPKLEEELDSSLSGNNKGNVVNSKDAILNSGIAVMGVAEAILIGIYGEKDIVKQKPYIMHHIRNYWIVDGSLPKGSKGGTFHIIIDDRTCKVIEITHRK